VRLGAGGDEVMDRLDHRSVDFERGSGDKTGVAVDELEAVFADQVQVLLLPNCLDDCALAVDQRIEVDRAGVGSDPGEALLPRPLAGLGRREKRLRGDAADVDAGAARGPGFDHHHAQTAAPRCDRGGEGTATRADDREVVRVGARVGQLVVRLAAHQHGAESTRRQAATCSALSARRAWPSASSSPTRSSAIR
jgi:hypothetical protein